jgi:hypothetical protein
MFGHMSVLSRYSRDYRLVLLVVLFSSVLFSGATPGGEPSGKIPRLLLVTVLQTSDALEASRLLATPADNRGSTAVMRRVRSTGGSGVDSHTIQMLVIEGESAHIDLHYSEPAARLLWVEEATAAAGPSPAIELTTEEITEGFHVRAQLAGTVVTLQLEAYSSPVAGSRSSGDFTHNLVTTVAGPLGRWMDLGGSLQTDAGVAGPKRYRVDHGQRGRMRILARVDLVHGESAPR